MKHRISFALPLLIFIVVGGFSNSLHAQTLTPTPVTLPENLAVIDADNVSNLTELLRLEVAPSEPGSVNQVVWSPDGKTLGIFGNSSAWFYDLYAGSLTKTYDYPTSTRLVVGSVDGPDGWRLALTTDEGGVKILDPQDGKTLKSLKGHTMPIWGIAYQFVDGLVGTVGKEGTARLWDWETGSLIANLEPVGGEANSVQFSPDGKILATGHQDQNVRLWDTETGDPIATLTGHTGTIWTLAFSPDGTQLASDGVDINTRLWDVATNTIVEVLCCHYEGPVVTLSFTPQGDVLATGGLPNILRLWSLETAENLFASYSFGDRVQGVQFSPDGKLLAVAAWDGTVSFWGVEAAS